jgi:hypothetical protein
MTFKFRTKLLVFLMGMHAWERGPRPHLGQHSLRTPASSWLALSKNAGTRWLRRSLEMPTITLASPALIVDVVPDLGQHCISRHYNQTLGQYIPALNLSFPAHFGRQGMHNFLLIRKSLQETETYFPAWTEVDSTVRWVGASPKLGRQGGTPHRVGTLKNPDIQWRP